MGHRIVDLSVSTQYGDGTVFCDTKSDLSNVDVTKLEQGAMALIQSGSEKGNVYTLLSTKAWEKLD